MKLSLKLSEVLSDEQVKEFEKRLEGTSDRMTEFCKFLEDHTPDKPEEQTELLLKYIGDQFVEALRPYVPDARRFIIDTWKEYLTELGFLEAEAT